MIADEEHGENGNEGSRRRIDYLPNFNRYSDRVEEDHSDDEAGNGAGKAIKAGTEHTENLFEGTSNDGAEQERGPLENEWVRAPN